MVEVRVVNEALLLKADPTWMGAINTVLVMKGVRVRELRCTGSDGVRPCMTLGSAVCAFLAGELDGTRRWANRRQRWSTRR
jgi:hypothetical protein